MKLVVLLLDPGIQLFLQHHKHNLKYILAAFFELPNPISFASN
jgi:hypothetical protein